MEYQGKYYYKVDVFDARHGYSFVMATNEKLDDEYDVVELALDNGLFQDDFDADRAIVDDLISEYDIKAFMDAGCVFNV